MPYPPRPTLAVLPQFRDSAGVRQTPAQRALLLRFVAREYEAGRSLRELGELTGRTQSAIRRALDQAGVPRRPSGAPPLAESGTGSPESRQGCGGGDVVDGADEGTGEVR